MLLPRLCISARRLTILFPLAAGEGNITMHNITVKNNNLLKLKIKLLRDTVKASLVTNTNTKASHVASNMPLV